MALSTERQKVTKILIFNDSSPSSTSPQPLSATTSDRSSLTTPRLKITPSTETTPPSHVSSSPAKQPASVSLFVIEEQVSVDCSPSPLCDFCRCVGWSHHYVLKRKYHLIIPASDEWMKPLRKDSLEVTSSSSRHLMHGVIHCNGFGHLLCINSDNVSSFLSGDRAMDLWDRLCSTLHTRSKAPIERKTAIALAAISSSPVPGEDTWDSPSCSSPGTDTMSRTKYDSFNALVAGEGCTKLSGERLSETAQARFTTPGSRIRFSLIKVNQEASTSTPGLNPYEDILYLYRNLLLTYPEFRRTTRGYNSELPSSAQSRRAAQRLDPEVTSWRARDGFSKRNYQRAEVCSRESAEFRNKDLEKIDENSGLESEGGNKIRTEFLVTGFGLDTWTVLRYEGGFDNWTVDCKCGAIDDDGERMVACDACKVWHHTKCHSIEDGEDVPSAFSCYRCFGY
ncbi:unnamed protein product [Brassica rapa subsp. trilocularis]|uniref:Zinc finger PHD-type domain-containing protein n=1 Tax=Brassica campestris TaxID=3711 RepID=M4ECX2_BRACM